MPRMGTWIVSCALALSLSGPAIAASALDHWIAAAALMKKMDAATEAGGASAVARYAAMAEVALANYDGKTVYYDPSAQRAYVLVDGKIQETLGAYALDDGRHVPMKEMQNPYPCICLMLGVYYNDIRQPEQALREAEAGLKSSVRSKRGAGGHTLDLVYEKARALIFLHRVPEALAAFDAGMKHVPGDSKSVAVARFWNGRGYVLRLLGRLDEAETDYRRALNAQPNNQTARRGLDAIASYRLHKSRAELFKLLPH